MADPQTLTILAISSYFKGEAFLRQAKKEGARVLLLTEEKIAGENWPRESIDEVFLMPDLSKTQDVINAVSYLCRSQVIDRIIALDEYDVENVATLREHLRLPGMGQSATRFFRDKLAMRIKTSENGILVPIFSPVFNYDRLRDFMDRVPPPWALKPRTEAGAMGIKKINNSEELWRWFDQLGDQQSGFLLEQFVPGDVFHVDSIIWDGKILFASAQQYGQPPLTVAHGGGVFVSRTLAPDSAEATALKTLNEQVISGLGMWRGVTHAEYIKANADGRIYFLEIAARVGGAHISDLVEAATGINLWAEWARIEIATVRNESYKLPKTKHQFGGLLVCLARQEHPDLSAYNDPEVVWKLDKKQHAGLIVTSDKADRVTTLIDGYVGRFAEDFLAVAPPKDKPTH
ncbi:MAG: ATP-grasp domain-containing protein [Chloroflexota bacterium]